MIVYSRLLADAEAREDGGEELATSKPTSNRTSKPTSKPTSNRTQAPDSKQVKPTQSVSIQLF